MSQMISLARPYAIAAYEFAQSHQAVNDWEAMLSSLRTLILTEEGQQLLRMPPLETSTYLTLLQPFMNKALDVHAVNFLKILIVRRRLALLPDIFSLFQALKRKAENKMTLDIITAVLLTQEQQESLLKTLSLRLKAAMDATFHVDENLIAGVIIHVNDEYVLDSSLRTQFERLKTQF